ncbi:MAG: GNAT family N-acetyltransferase [Parcubacteria group bacterium]|nr:GNAT family N-acetyltransferase [Parcubacteria group bacterium]
MKTMRINPFEQPQIVQAIAMVYQQSFGSEPWNEGYICPVCEKVFARTFSHKVCPACAERSEVVLVVEYWPIGKIISDFYREMKKTNPICIVAQSDEKTIGFAWGYQVFANPDLDEHLDAPDLHKSLHGDFFYLDECAIAPAFQKKGIGKLLVGHIFREQQQGQILLRTKDNSQMCNLIKNMGGNSSAYLTRKSYNEINRSIKLPAALHKTKQGCFSFHQTKKPHH